MWTDNNDPLENEDSAGYSDWVSDSAFAAAVVVITTLIAMGVWVYRTGGIPPWAA